MPNTSLRISEAERLWISEICNNDELSKIIVSDLVRKRMLIALSRWPESIYFITLEIFALRYRQVTVSLWAGAILTALMAIGFILLARVRFRYTARFMIASSQLSIARSVEKLLSGNSSDRYRRKLANSIATAKIWGCDAIKANAPIGRGLRPYRREILEIAQTYSDVMEDWQRAVARPNSESLSIIRTNSIRMLIRAMTGHTFELADLYVSVSGRSSQKRISWIAATRSVLDTIIQPAVLAAIIAGSVAILIGKK